MNGPCLFKFFLDETNFVLIISMQENCLRISNYISMMRFDQWYFYNFLECVLYIFLCSFISLCSFFCSFSTFICVIYVMRKKGQNITSNDQGTRYRANIRKEPGKQHKTQAIAVFSLSYYTIFCSFYHVRKICFTDVLDVLSLSHYTIFLFILSYKNDTFHRLLRCLVST